MHSTDTSYGVTFFHNGDYSGDVVFRAQIVDDSGAVAAGLGEKVRTPFAVLASVAVDTLDADVHDGAGITARVDDASSAAVRVTVPVGAVRDLVATRVLSERIEALESMTLEELFDAGCARELSGWATADPCES